MKSLVVLIFVALTVFGMIQMTSCCKQKKSGVIEFPLADTVVIPANTIIPSLGIPFYLDSIFSRTLANTVRTDLAAKSIPEAWVSSITCAEMSMQIQSPATQKFDFTDSLVFSIANRNGSSRKAIGFSKILPTASIVNFTVPSVDLKSYLLQDSMMLVIGGNLPVVADTIPIATTLKFYGKFVGIYNEQ